MKPPSPKSFQRIQAANDFALDLLAKRLPANEVIDEMIEHHGAVSRFRGGTHQLCCAGIIGQATSGTSAELLGSWRRRAMAALQAHLTEEEP